MVLELVCLHRMTLHKDWTDTYMLVIIASIIVVGIRTIKVYNVYGVIRTLSDVRHIWRWSDEGDKESYGRDEVTETLE